MVPDEHLQSEIERLEQRFAENPQGRVFAHLADLYRQAGRREEAEALVVEGLKRHPDYLSAHLVLGRVYLDWGRHPQAQAQFARVLELDPQNLVALRALGELAAARGVPEEARRWYERVLQIDPYNDEVRDLLKELPAAEPAEAPPETGEGGEAAGAPETKPARGEGPIAGYSRYGDEMIDAAAAQAQPEAAPEEGPPAPELEAPGAEEMPGVAAPPQPAPSVPPEAGEAAEGEVTPVTETMAELYAEQAMYEDAIEIYRELQARRPGETRFARRIEELEERARQRSAQRLPLPIGPDEPLPRERPKREGAEPPSRREPPARREAPAPSMDWLEAPVSPEPVSSEEEPWASPADEPWAAAAQERREEEEVELPDWLLGGGAGPAAQPAARAPAPGAPAPPTSSKEVELPDWLAEPKRPASPASPAAERAPRREFAFRTTAGSGELPARDPFAASFEGDVGAEGVPPFLTEGAPSAARPPAGPPPASAAPPSPGPDEREAGSIADYFDTLLSAGARRAAATPPPASAASPVVPGAAPGAGQPEAGESEDDLAQFQSWLRSLKR